MSAMMPCHHPLFYYPLSQYRLKTYQSLINVFFMHLDMLVYTV